MKLLLITGFLGAGKTTFLKRLIELWQDQRLALIVNEFGKVGIDGRLLDRPELSLREIAGGSVFCSCRLDQFEEALGQVVTLAPSLILVEASGLSDPTAVRSVLGGFPQIEYMGCVALGDASRLHKVLDIVRVCSRQLAVADLILLNKTDLITPEEQESLLAMLALRFPRARVVPTRDAAFDPAWLEDLGAHAEAAPLEETRDITLQKATVRLSPDMSKKSCEAFLKLVYEDTYRIKGFVNLLEGSHLVDCVGPACNLTACPQELADDVLVMLAGPGMPLRKSLKAAQAWYPEQVMEIAFG